MERLLSSVLLQKFNYLLSYILDCLNRVQKNFEGTLVGADRAKDLAVLKVFFFFLFHG